MIATTKLIKNNYVASFDGIPINIYKYSTKVSDEPISHGQCEIVQLL